MQETALNHVKSTGLLGDGFGSTPEMSKRNLFWVVSQMQVLVEQYPCWYRLQTILLLLFELYLSPRAELAIVSGFK